MDKVEQKRRAKYNRHCEKIAIQYLRDKGLYRSNVKRELHEAMRTLFPDYKDSWKVIRRFGKYLEKNKDHNGFTVYRYSDVNFYLSKEWRQLRVDALVRYGRRCCLCGRSANDGAALHVDHIKPRSKYPDLSLDINNLQILCSECNIGKSNRYKEKWRQ